MVTITIYYYFTTMGRIFSLNWIIKIISKVNLLKYLKRKNSNMAGQAPFLKCQEGTLKSMTQAMLSRNFALNC